MRMDIEISPGALEPLQAGARDVHDQAGLGTGGMCGYCLCCVTHPDHRREKRANRLGYEQATGVLWCHAASTSKTAPIVAAQARMKRRVTPD
jgi:hypothetical protein